MRKAPGATLRLLLLAVLTPQLVPGQPGPVEGIFTDEVEVTEVLLDVVVTDKQDRIIVGLGLDDFVVSEDGERVQVTSATFYSSRRFVGPTEALVSRGAAIETVPQDRYFILFVQERSLGEKTSRRTLVDRHKRAGRHFARWLVEEAQLADRLAVVSFRHRLKVHQDFTTDREVLLEAVDRAVDGRDPEKIPPTRRSELAGDPPAFASLATAKELRRARLDIHHALRLVAAAVKSVPGRKNLIFLGRGFGDFGSYRRYRPAPNKMKHTLNALNDANVAVYTLDVMPPETGYNLQASLRDLAVATGGRFFLNRQSFTEPLRKISEMTSGYYLLSYESKRPASDSGYQRVEVGVRNPELRVQAREGYLYGSGLPPGP
jgi:VWFA-related protein